jgi:hypothetical protein
MELVPGLEGRQRFHGLVAANVLAIVARELAGEETALVAEWRRAAGPPRRRRDGAAGSVWTACAQPCAS